MLVKLLVGLSGGIMAVPGDEVSLADDEAKRLIAAGFAVPAVTNKVERATPRKVKETR